MMNDSEQHTLARKLEYLRKNLEMLAAYRSLSANDIENNLEKRLQPNGFCRQPLKPQLIVLASLLRSMICAK